MAQAVRRTIRGSLYLGGRGGVFLRAFHTRNCPGTVLQSQYCDPVPALYQYSTTASMLVRTEPVPVPVPQCRHKRGEFALISQVGYG
eukprot:1418871-Rhodomonas_salina.1